MSYIFMKALESAPTRYDRGIRWLGWGKLAEIRAEITDKIGLKGTKALELGCGTADQAIQLAQMGVKVTALDHSKGMLAIAEEKIHNWNTSPSSTDPKPNITANPPNAPDAPDAQAVSRAPLPITLLHQPVTDLQGFSEGEFDTVYSCLCFSELDPLERHYIIKEVYRILKPGGLFLLADEVKPNSFGKQVLHAIIDFPLRVITYLLTQTSTHALKEPTQTILGQNFSIKEIDEYQMGSFQTIVAMKPNKNTEIASHIAENNYDIATTHYSYMAIAPPTLSPLARFWQTALRFLPHSSPLGIIPVGEPNSSSPVIATCNFALTVHKVVTSLQKRQISAWVLVAPSKGINVWCGSCGHHFTTDSITTVIRLSGIENCVEKHSITLPQLAAPSIEPDIVYKETGWKAKWGPVRIDDYSPDMSKPTRPQRTVSFNFRERFDIANVFWLMIFLLAVIPLSLWIILGSNRILPISILALVPLYSYGTFLLWPLLPGKEGLVKMLDCAVILQLIMVGLWQIFTQLFTFQWFWVQSAVLWALTLILASDIDGMTPLFRSRFSANLWKRGKTNMFKIGKFELELSPYGRIAADMDKCNGCRRCLDVCPADIIGFDEKAHVASLKLPQNCVNCNACVNRCPQTVFSLIPEG